MIDVVIVLPRRSTQYFIIISKVAWNVSLFSEFNIFCLFSLLGLSAEKQYLYMIQQICIINGNCIMVNRHYFARNEASFLSQTKRLPSIFTIYFNIFQYIKRILQQNSRMDLFNFCPFVGLSPSLLSLSVHVFSV